MPKQSIYPLSKNYRFGDADGYFETSDGRLLPYFLSYEKNILQYKNGLRFLKLSSPKLLSHKLLRRKDKVVSEIKWFLERTTSTKPYKILELASGVAIDSIIISRRLHNVVTASDINPWFHARSREKKIIMPWFKAVLPILGVNCGSDHCTSYIRNIYAQLNVSYIKMSSSNIRFENNSFDLVVCRNAFMEIQQIEKTLCEIKRVLRPGGMLIATWDYYYHWSGAHNKGIISIPWGHALMTRDDYLRYIANHYSHNKFIQKRNYTAKLHKYTFTEWRSLFAKCFTEIHMEPQIDVLAAQYAPQWIFDNLPPSLFREDVLTERIFGVFCPN